MYYSLIIINSGNIFYYLLWLLLNIGWYVLFLYILEIFINWNVYYSFFWNYPENYPENHIRKCANVYDSIHTYIIFQTWKIATLSYVTYTCTRIKNFHKKSYISVEPLIFLPFLNSLVYALKDFYQFPLRYTVKYLFSRDLIFTRPPIKIYSCKLIFTSINYFYYTLYIKKSRETLFRVYVIISRIYLKSFREKGLHYLKEVDKIHFFPCVPFSFSLKIYLESWHSFKVFHSSLREEEEKQTAKDSVSVACNA